MGRSHVFIFEEYFSDLSIIKSLIGYRLKIAKKRHDDHFYDRIVQSEKLKSRESELQLCKIFPPRNHWLRPSLKKRKNPKKGDLNYESLLFTINRFRGQSLERQPLWVFELNKLIAEIRSKALYSSITELPSPKLIPISKNKKDGEFDLYRPISFVEDLTSRIVMDLTARYLLDQFDTLFKKSSFAFRRSKIYHNRIPTHHDCIREIKRFKEEKKSIYVSECDIKSFFDSISHEEIRKAYAAIKTELFNLNGIRIFGRADNFVEAFLNSYSIDYAIGQSEEYFKTEGIKGKLSFPKDELLNTFYSDNPDALKNIGVSQGTSFSILFANIILHDNDRRMEEKFQDPNDFLYMRYCDDMIILSTNKKKANSAYEEYIELLKEKKLLHHIEKPLLPYSNSLSKRDFWDRKSKKGYLWNENSYPWIAFVGYQIRYDDFVRIRLSSIKNELKKQEEFVQSLIRKINKGVKEGNRFRIFKSHKSIYNRATNRMGASAVGRISLLRNQIDSSISWINGFRGILKDKKVFRNNLKELDRNRNRQLELLDKKLLSLLLNHPIKRKKSKKFTKLTYLGRPFSYYHRSFLNDNSGKSIKDNVTNLNRPFFLMFINRLQNCSYSICSVSASYAGIFFLFLGSLFRRLTLEGLLKSKERR
ncbi:reverse transcriptase domain-containing protein [Leptospira santarosai]|uniref:reverse transcriptase domain-containing protein n=1 Tax=Leptospira santarosai TaxID=28183 RepID=UPI0024AF9631|nr:reverse transcriptase domain-containing protein [Leptospira santarosai]MDI7218761.1 reverse transcriptase domain-containing protein [Leptospira santarosai]